VTATEHTLAELRTAAAGCTACPLYAPATQTVFGEGPEDAPLVLVGEQPGDREDLEGHPFVGPAGALLRRVMSEMGLDPDGVFLTNAVKHFKFVQRGKRRIHQKPTTEEINACHPWLERELAVLRPRLVVALGATAARALTGRPVTISKVRGQILEWDGPGSLIITVHPSAILRADDDQRPLALRQFKHDLAVAVDVLDGGT
jgi:uracil-DNA glycosylase family protein